MRALYIYIYIYTVLSFTQCYDFIVLTSLTHPRKILSVVLQTCHSQPLWPLSARKLFSLEVFLVVRKEIVVQRGQIRWVHQVFQNIRVKICQLVVRSGRFVRSSIVLKEEDSFWNFALTFGDQLLLQFVEKCNSYLPWWLHPFPGSLQANSIFVPEDRHHHLAWSLCLLNFFFSLRRGTTVFPFVGLLFGLWIICIQVCHP
jgi:hypothetical protein